MKSTSEHGLVPAPLRGDPEFESLMESMRKGGRLWNSEAWKGGFTENLTDAEKIATLSRFWSEVKFNFAYPSKLIESDWDRTYHNWIPKVLATKSAREYYMELLKLSALFGDAHTNVIPPGDLDLYSKPALRTEMIEGRPVIAEVYSPTLAAEGLRAGQELVRIDGVAVLEYARSRVEPYVSASSPQDLRLRVFRYGLLNGRKTDPVRLTLRDEAGREQERTVARVPSADAKYPPAFAWRREGSAAVVTVNSFESGKVVDEWKKAWPETRQARSLVLDLRDNGGGSQLVGEEILRDLIRKPTQRSRTRVRTYRPADRVLGIALDWDEAPGREVQPNFEPFAGDVTVLAGPGMFSVAEDFLVEFKVGGRGRVVGETTAGSTGLPLYFDLPGGGHARVCTKQDRWPDGTEWVGKGIEPDVRVEQTLSDLRDGRDTVLSFALR